MTQRPYPDPVRSTTPPSTDDPAPVVRSVGDLLAAVPALLGFVPERSLVLICFSTGTRTVVEVCMRQDLPDRLDHPVLGDVVDRCAEVCDREGFDAVLAVLVTGTRFAMPYEVVADLLRTTLQRWDIELMGVHHVRHLVAGETWRSLGGDPRRGTLPDPIASSVAASTVASGRQIRSSREDIALLLMPVAPSECARFEDSRRHVDLEDGPLTDTELLSDTVDDLAFVHATGEIDHLVAARIMRAVAVISVRDAMLGLATTDLAPTAEMVWVELTRRVTGPDRAHPATLLAVWSYLRGDGPLASVALETALVADPHYRLAHLLDTALQNGLRPTIVRDLVTSARALAADLGVDLPPDA